MTKRWGEDEVEKEEKERRGRKLPFGGRGGGLKCNSEDDQT